MRGGRPSCMPEPVRIQQPTPPKSAARGSHKDLKVRALGHREQHLHLQGSARGGRGRSTSTPPPPTRPGLLLLQGEDVAPASPPSGAAGSPAVGSAASGTSPSTGASAA